jgi:hypothetical protein
MLNSWKAWTSCGEFDERRTATVRDKDVAFLQCNISGMTQVTLKKSLVVPIYVQAGLRLVLVRSTKQRLRKTAQEHIFYEILLLC